MNAGSADWLRERLAASLRLDELYLFGSMRLFATEREERDVRVGMKPPTVESAILVATKAPSPKAHHLRVVLLEDETAAAVAITGDPSARTPPREPLLKLMAGRAGARAGRSKGILVHSVRQAQLRSTRPWPVKHAPRDVAARVVAHLQAQLDDDASPVERLAERWVVVRGIETGADAYSPRIQRRLAERTRSQLAAAGARTGDPILELPPGAERLPPWRENPRLLAHAPEPHALLYGAIDDANYASLVWLRREDAPPPQVLEALERWREVLRTRAEFSDNPRRQWWETKRSRARAMLMGPKVIALYRTDRGRFSLDEAGAWQPSNKTTIVTPRHEELPVAYLCGLLNSELLDLWYAVRGKAPRDIWRNYEPKPMNEMPFRHVVHPNGWFPSAPVSGLAGALASGVFDDAVAHAYTIRSAIGSPAGDADAAAAIEHLVRAIAGNRRALLPLRAIAPELRRAVKNPWRTHGVTVDRRATLADLPPSKIRSLRLDPTLSVSVSGDGALGRARLTEDALVFEYGRRRTARVEDPPDRLAFLCEVLTTGRLTRDDLLSVRLPTSLHEFTDHVAHRQEEVDGLLEHGRRMVEAVERLVCGLYLLPGELTEIVIESAVTRAGSVAQGDE